MTTPFKQDYAFGLAVSTQYGHKVIEHGGGIEGFNTHLAYYPEDKLVVVVLGNLNGGFPSEVALKLAQVAHGVELVPITERKEITVPTKVPADYVGAYEATPAFSIVITLEDGHLTAQATNQPKFQLFAESETMFFLKVVDAQMEFFRNEKGQVTHMVLHQNGRDLKGVKK